MVLDLFVSDAVNPSNPGSRLSRSELSRYYCTSKLQNSTSQPRDLPHQKHGQEQLHAHLMQ